MHVQDVLNLRILCMFKGTFLLDGAHIYFQFLFQRCLSFTQSVGMIGGKPNHAHWFIGYVGKNRNGKCPKISYTKVSDKMQYANSVDPDQTALEGAV